MEIFWKVIIAVVAFIVIPTFIAPLLIGLFPAPWSFVGVLLVVVLYVWVLKWFLGASGLFQRHIDALLSPIKVMGRNKVSISFIYKKIQLWAMYHSSCYFLLSCWITSGVTNFFHNLKLKTMCLKHPKKEGVFLTRHHLLPRQRGGHAHPSNILRLWNTKHRCWHFIFRDRNLIEICCQINLFHREFSATKEWIHLFGTKELWEIRLILVRVLRIKSKTKKKRKPKHLNQSYFVEKKYLNKVSETY